MMQEQYQMSMMGELKFFLGLQIRQQSNDIFISQEKFLKDCLKKFGMQDCKGYSTPMPAKHHLGPDANGKEFDQKVYRSMVGSLLYLCHLGQILCLVFACVLDIKRHQRSRIT